MEAGFSQIKSQIYKMLHIDALMAMLHENTLMLAVEYQGNP